jgi:hypothetical protein
LVAQGRTVSEALEIARDVARKLIEARRERRLNFSAAGARLCRELQLAASASADDRPDWTKSEDAG